MKYERERRKDMSTILSDISTVIIPISNIRTCIIDKATLNIRNVQHKLSMSSTNSPNTIDPLFIRPDNSIPGEYFGSLVVDSAQCKGRPRMPSFDRYV